MSLMKKLKKSSKKESNDQKETTKNIKDVSMPIIEHAYGAGDYVEAAIMLKELLEHYGERKKKNHRTKGREFMYFILSNKHKNLKNVGHTHWVNINKIIQSRKHAGYPYHKQNLRNAIDFFKKEIKSLNTLKVYIVH